MSESIPAPALPLSAASPPLGPIEQTPLELQIADRRRRASVTGLLRPSTVLVETALAEQLKVSHALASFDPASVAEPPP